MQTPYVEHKFGDAVEAKLRSRQGWLTAGVASSIPWPRRDVWVRYDGEDYVLRGTDRDGQPSPPGITVPCDANGVDAALARVYRFASVLGWYKRGFVDVGGYAWGSHPILYGDRRQVYSTVGQHGDKSFDCNHLPMFNDEPTRKALAFWREGQRLLGVHDSYAFLSFYKVIECQFGGTDADKRRKVAWIGDNLERLGGRAAARVAALRASGVDVNRHLFESGRCAVAHASLEGLIVDPDIPGDRRRLGEDLDVVQGLAERFIRQELKVPDEMDVYRIRDRLEPWRAMLQQESLLVLTQGGTPANVDGLENRIVSIGLWPDGLIPGMEEMTMHVDAVENGVVKVVLVNDRSTLLLVFFLDFLRGRAHTNLDDGGMITGDNVPSEADALAYATYFYRVVGNSAVELFCGGPEPVECEIVIPVNIIPEDPAVAVERFMTAFRRQGAMEDAEGAAE